MRSRLRHLPIMLGVLAAVTAAAAVVAAVTAGGAGAAGVTIGIGLVVVSYVLSTLAIAWADSVDPKLVFPVGMGMYVTKFSLFGIALIALLDSDWPGIVPLAMGIVVGVAAWTAAQIWWVSGPGSPHPR